MASYTAAMRDDRDTAWRLHGRGRPAAAFQALLAAERDTPQRLRLRNTWRYTHAVTDEYRWPDSGPEDLRDSLTAKDVVEALYAPAAVRMHNRRPAAAPTFMAICAPDSGQRLIVVVCVRAEANEPWTIVGARTASANEQLMWRKYTS